MKKLARGTFLDVERSQDRPGKVRKRFYFPLTEGTMKNLRSTHEKYVGHLGKVITLPETTMETKKLDDGKYQVDIYQDDLSLEGSSLTDFLNSEKPVAVRLNAFSSALKQTLEVYMYSRTLFSGGIVLGLESSPNNWWVKENGDVTFFDTTPPLVMENNRVNTDVLVMKEVPTFIGRLFSWLARSKLTRSLSERVIRSYAFDWPTTVRTLLIKTIDCAPKLRSRLTEAAGKAVEALDIGEKAKAGFRKKLSNFSIRLELLKLKIFKFLDSIGKKENKAGQEQR